MILRNVNDILEIRTALKNINKKYDDNIIFNNLEQLTLYYNNSNNKFDTKEDIKFIDDNDSLFLDNKPSKIRKKRNIKKTLTFNVTLKVKNSRLSGARRSYTGRRLISACWHVHADFLEELFKINENIKITSCGKKIKCDEIRDNFREMLSLCECDTLQGIESSFSDIPDESYK